MSCSRYGRCAVAVLGKEREAGRQGGREGRTLAHCALPATNFAACHFYGCKFNRRPFHIRHFHGLNQQWGEHALHKSYQRVWHQIACPSKATFLLSETRFSKPKLTAHTQSAVWQSISRSQLVNAAAQVQIRSQLKHGLHLTSDKCYQGPSWCAFVVIHMDIWQT